MPWKQCNWRDRRAEKFGRRREAGFTLLEVVVATTLMAAVMVILFSGLRLGMNAWDRGEKHLEKLAREQGGVEALTLQAAAGVPRILVAKEGQLRVPHSSFRGTSDELRFLTRFSWAWDRSQGLWLAAYRVVETDDGRQQLVVSEAPVPDEAHGLAGLLADEVPALRSQPLGDPADRIELAYWQPGSGVEPATWVSEWRSEERSKFPRGVRVRWWWGQRVETVMLVFPVVEAVP